MSLEICSSLFAVARQQTFLMGTLNVLILNLQIHEQVQIYNARWGQYNRSWILYVAITLQS